MSQGREEEQDDYRVDESGGRRVEKVVVFAADV